MTGMRVSSMNALVAVVTTLTVPTSVHAFCGFYVSGTDGQMFNNATQVVLMREGTRTVLSMQNNYQGPPADFAMVVPVPHVLQKDSVKTLDPAIFERVDQLTAPRLVEYWEQDPCMPRVRTTVAGATGAAAPRGVPSKVQKKMDLGVTIEAAFKVGEYEIVILSARDATGLDTWLKRENYKIPLGAEPLFRPYVEAGSKFFVAKVDTTKVTFKDGMAQLSPLRFHYDAETFSLPVRLGLINSNGTQDLIVHILANNKRYAVKNYKNVIIPTNLDVTDEVRTRFGEFYTALFDATLEKNPGAVITEYAWDAGTCDPCPTPALTRRELATLGEDVLYMTGSGPTAKRASGAQVAPRRVRRQRSSFVLTRLHARYKSDAVATDLMFDEVPAITGGREFLGDDGALERGAQKSSRNQFQARYAIRHAWTGPITCGNPRYGIWGGPPAGKSHRSPTAATDLAFAPRGQVSLPTLVKTDIPELKIAAADKTASGAPPDRATTSPASDRESGAPAKNSNESDRKGCDVTSAQRGVPVALALAIALIFVRSPRRRSHTA